MPEVSLIVTCVDMLEMTRKCLELIYQHTPPVYELIIVCDAPSEEMQEWLLKCCRKAGGLKPKIFINDDLVGTPTARNMGIKAADGKYICFLDNDITVTQGWFEPLMETLSAHPDYGWVASRIMRGDQVMNFGVVSSTLITKEAIDRVGIFDERFSEGAGWEDNDYLLRFWLEGYKPHGVLKSTVYHPPQATTLNAVHGDKLSQRYQRNLEIFIEKWGQEVMLIDWRDIPCAVD